MQYNIKRCKKGKVLQMKEKNFPVFLLIGLILIIMIVLSMYYLFLYYAPQTIVLYNGYAIEPKKVAENLQNNNIEEVEKFLKMVEVNEDDTLFKKLNTYYVGKNQKKKIDINYPLYVEGKMVINNISKDTQLITINYEKVEGYPEFTIADGVMYNGDDLLRADGNEYLFLKSKENIYTNVKVIKIKTSNNTYEIPIYSQIYFIENRITYYEIENGIMKYKNIGDIDEESQISLDEKTLTYKQFLIELEIIEEKKEKEPNEQEKEEETKNDETENSETEDNGNNENGNSGNLNDDSNIKDEQNENSQEQKYYKPEVTLSDINAKVYVLEGNLNIKDISGAITEFPTLEIRKKGKIYKRVYFSGSGGVQITGLIPNTEFEIIGKYTYKDENGKKQKEEFIKTKIQTKNIEELGAIKLSFENGDIYSNKIEIKNLKIENDIQEEAVKGIYKIEVLVDKNKYKVKNKEIKELLKGNTIVYSTEETVKSNSKIDYEIKIYDKYGNEFKVENNKGTTKTSKEKPSLYLKVKSQEVTEVKISLELKNKDNVKIKNYKCIITDTANKEVHKEQLEYNQIQIILTNLNPNDYYTIRIYGDYDLEDDKGFQENILMSETQFTTLPISSLGYIQLNTTLSSIGINDAKIKIKIDELITDQRLIKILSYCEIKLIADNKDVLEITRKMTYEELDQIKNSQEIEFDFDTLNSNTKYKIEIIMKSKQGDIEEIVQTNYELKEITTFKIPAQIQLKNEFVTESMIDFDIRVEDIDNAILLNKVIIELRDGKTNIIERKELSTNEDFERQIYNQLEEKQTYYLNVYALEYNEGHTDETYKNNYILLSKQIHTEYGISGKLDLLNVQMKGTGKNLINVASENNWYVYPIRNTWDYYGKTYNANTKELRLGTDNRNNRRAVYDLREYAGKTVTMSFKIKYVDITSKGDIYIQNAKTDKNRIKINNITEEYTEKSYTLKVDESGYLGFYIGGGNGVYIKDLQIELGDVQTKYEEFKYIFNAEIKINLKDNKNEIVTNDYYIRIHENGNQILEERYEEINENNEVLNKIKTYQVKSNSKYSIELLIKIRDRFYSIDTVDFETQDGKELKGISTKEEFFEIQPYGNYIVLNDLDLSGCGNEIIFGYHISFNGILDFNGYTLTRDMQNTNLSVFNSIGIQGIIKNLNLNIKLNNVDEKNLNGGLFQTNYGTISNIQVNLIESTRVPNSNVWLLGYSNPGTIENFIINYEEPLYGSFNLGALFDNNGIIKNGYIYGKNIKAVFHKPDTDRRVASPLIRRNLNHASLSNVYCLTSVDTIEETNNDISNLVIFNNDNAKVNNVYTVGIGNIYYLNRGPNIYNTNSKNINNNYYFTDEVFSDSTHTKTTKLALWDKLFQDQLLNSEQQFIIDGFVDKGYYPHIKMAECMPRQKYIELPEVQDKDLVDILATEVIEQNSGKTKVKFSVNNPSAEKITEIRIENINVNILEQTYEDGKSEVIAELYDPIKYTSNYNLMSITSKGSIGIPYTRNFKQGERIIRVDLYKEINSISEWKAINSSPTENYILMTDLDFINEGDSIRITNTFTGKINGNNHTIKNIFLTEGSLFKQVNGAIYDMYIKNFRQNNTDSGIIYKTNGAIIDNIHITDGYIKGDSKVSGFYAGILGRYFVNTVVKNCSANNVEIIQDSDKILDEISVGGLIENATTTIIENSYVNNININCSNAINYRIGGLVGILQTNSSIKNSYVTGGLIKTKGNNVGGLVGKLLSSSTVERAYSDVKLYCEGNYIGGIIGYTEGSNTILNNLNIGDIYNVINSTLMSRIVGNSLVEGNYAYDRQRMNGYIVEETNGAKLLTYDELCEQYTYEKIIGLEEYFNYSDVQNGILPKLYNTNGQDLLPNQKDIKIGMDAQLSIDDITVEKDQNDSVNILLKVDNPKEILITGIQVENMETSIIKNNTLDGKTFIEIQGKPNRYYDSYKISTIKYIQGNNEKEEIVDAKIEVQFYKEIYNYEDWQSIEEGTYQNYKLLSDIDFNGKKDIKKNVTMARFESNGKTLKNIQITVDSDYSGLIKEISTTLSGVNFENIELTATKALNNIGIIVKCNNEIKNINFKNITIDTKGNQKSSNVGCIVLAEGETASNINIENITISGKDYVSGLFTSCNMVMTNITARNININSTGRYAAGILSGKSKKGSAYITVEDSNIAGKDGVGGVLNTASGSANYIIVRNTKISGENSIGGVGVYTTTINCCTVDNCEIIGSKTVGGIASNGGDIRQCEVINTQIICDDINSSKVGGLLGTSAPGSKHNKVENTQIITKGNFIGGMIGEFDNSWSSGINENNIVQNVTIQGNAYVGGFAGAFKQGTIKQSEINAKVIASSNTAGGIVGLLENQEMTAATQTIYIYDNIVANCTVSSPTKVGGLIGDVQKELYVAENVDFYYRNLAHAYLLCDDQYVSLGIGGAKEENNKLKNTYFYKYSKINNSYINEEIDTIKQSQYLSANELRDKNTYLNKIGMTGYNCSVLSKNKYPYLYLWSYISQTGIDLPEDPIDAIEAQVQMLSIVDNLENEVKLANKTDSKISYEIYAISANEINIDFNNVSEGASLIIDDIEIPIKSRTYTFKYDFSTRKMLTLKVSTESESETEEINITISPEDVRHYTSLIDNNYAYLKDGKLVVNGEEQSGEFVNLYGSQALTANGEIYDIQTLTIEQSINKVEDLILQKNVTPRQQYIYQDNIIKVYGKYSTINDEVRKQIYVIRNNKMSILSSDLDMKIGQAIIEYVNDKEYETILKEDGTLLNLKEKLVYPDNFQNTGIKEISQNENKEKTEVLVYYENGNVIIFDYLTGKIKNDNEQLESNILEQLKTSLMSLFEDSEEETIANEYETAKELTETLKETPIEESEEQIETEYISSYNPVSQEYEVYSEKEIIEAESEEPESETQKIAAKGLQEFYSSNKIKGKKVENISGITIIIAIIFIIVICIIVGNKIQKKYHN